MNKTALKNFAVRARRKLIEDVTHKAYELGITKEKALASDTFDGGSMVREIDNGKVLRKHETKQREKLINVIKEKGYEQVMEEVAYTWFNRFIALRFMEVNDYLPTGVRVLSSLQEGKSEPDIMQQASNLDLDIDRETIYSLQDSGNMNELYKYLLIKQCNQLGEIMPGVFEKIADYSELLLPDNLLGEGAIIRDLVDSIEEYDWKIELGTDELELEAEKGDHGIEIIGWLYQYYISEKKDEVFAGLKKNKKITKENIPAATQLFTPKWIVKYMIENSLGRLWLESHPNEELKSNWKYYLEEAEQEPEVQEQLDKLKNPNLKPEEIKVLDPAMGSGHILSYAFDVLYEIYLSAGYSEQDVPNLILKNNLYGLEIDDRAGQLANFALIMKARSRKKKIFNDMPELNLCSIQESNAIPKEAIEYLVDPQESEIEKYMHREEAEYLMEVFYDAKEYGSILEVKEIDYDTLEKRVEEIRNQPLSHIMELKYKDDILEKFAPLVKQGKIMSQKYDVVCTNPPYMGRKGLNPKLVKLLDNRYEKSKGDLFAAFMEVCLCFLKEAGYWSMINQHSWLFLTSYEKLREKVVDENIINSLLHLGSHSFEDVGGEIVQTTVFTMRKASIKTHNGFYIRLVDERNAKLKEKKALESIHNLFSDNTFIVKLTDFKNIPGNPIAYWASAQMRKIFNNEKLYYYTISDGQNKTGNNEKYVRFTWEIKKTDTGKGNKWILYAKGGSFRKWAGNIETVVDWSEEARHHYRADPVCRIISEKYWFRRGITWSLVSSNYTSFRLLPENATFDVGGSSVFVKDDLKLHYFLGLLNSKIFFEVVKLLNPTLNFQVKDIRSIPVIINEVELSNVNKVVKYNVSLSKTDWDSFETSWDFHKHPLLIHKGDAYNIKQAYQNWANFAENQFNQLKQNEEELNRIFIDIYGLQDELTPEVEDKDITINKADQLRDIKSFLSYAIGCTFGRYSLDEGGLIYAGGSFNEKYRFNNDAWELNTSQGWMQSSLAIEGDNIIPLVDDDYFENDIVRRIVDFIRASFGHEHLEENLSFIAETLGAKAGETSRQTIRKYFLKDFYKDHIRTYKKRPIYWFFDSGKENGFKALIYLHRYDPLTVARVRTDYLHKLQKNYEAAINQLDTVINSEVSTREKATAKKRKDKIRKQLEECRYYDQALAHVANQRIELDLDDGVKVNYAKFQEVEIPQSEGRRPLKADLLAKI